MKLYLLIFSLLLIVFSACNDDFLQTESNNSYLLEDTLRITNKTQNEIFNLQIDGLTNQKYTVRILPKWIHLTEMEGRFVNSQVQLTISALGNELASALGFYNGTIGILIDQVGQINIPVQYGNFGNPHMNINKNELDINFQSSISFTLTNPDNSGILYWSIPELPDWLEIAKNWGIIQPGTSELIKLNVVRDDLDIGTYTYDLQIQNNAGSTLTIPVNMRVKDFMDPDFITLLEGNVVDAEFCQYTEMIALVAKSPSRLYLFDTKNRMLKHLDLNSIPSCVSITEDGSKLVIGTTNAQIIEINVSSCSVINSHSIDCIPYDVVVSDNSWVYISPLEDQWVYFRSLNLTDGSLVKSSRSDAIYERTILRKVPGRFNLLGTRTALSPSGILLFDIGDGACNENINYWHESIGNFWTSADGNRIFCETGKIYIVPEYENSYVHSVEISPVGDLSFSWDLQIKWIEHNINANKIFVVRANSTYSSLGEDAWIEIFDAFNYSELENFHTSPFSFSSGNSEYLLDTKPEFVFSSKDGNCLFAVKNILSRYGFGNAWSIEKMSIE